MLSKDFRLQTSPQAFEPFLSCAVFDSQQRITAESPKDGKTDFLTQEIKIN